MRIIETDQIKSDLKKLVSLKAWLKVIQFVGVFCLMFVHLIGGLAGLVGAFLLMLSGLWVHSLIFLITGIILLSLPRYIPVLKDVYKAL